MLCVWSIEWVAVGNQSQERRSRLDPEIQQCKAVSVIFGLFHFCGYTGEHVMRCAS